MTSATNPKTIDLYGYCNQGEAIAGGDITPGMLINRSSATQVVAHATSGGAAQPSFAVEYDITGGTIDDAYESGDQVIFKTFTPGSGVYALLTTSQVIAAGAFLSSAGNGRLKAAAAGDNIVAQAVEAVTTTGDPARIKVETVTGYVSV
jgi:hypothetical protein